MYNWAIAYFTKDQSLRMIIRPIAERKNESLITILGISLLP
jgi:hypothetical protein